MNTFSNKRVENLNIHSRKSTTKYVNTKILVVQRE